MTILIAAGLMGLIGLLFSISLGIAGKKFAVEVDPRLNEIEKSLPGVNCGGCGYASCAMYAEAVAGEKAPVDLCVVGGQDTARDVAHVMGISVSDEAKDKIVAVVFCQGDSEASAFPGEYRGIRDCAAAVYSQDVSKRCKYGCVGLGSCVDACPFDAIHLSKTGIPFVDAEKCTACGKCVAACPRNLIELHPLKHDSFVYCKSQDPAIIAKKVCVKACTGCTLCAKSAAKDDNPDAVRMEGNLAVVNTKNYAAKPEYGAKCPTGAYSTYVNIVNKDKVLGRTPAEPEPVGAGAGGGEDGND
jgi:Na+-translocating ferredoxin:NAD+ oxidoreductase subunit B